MITIPYEDFGGTGPILHFAHPNAYPPACFGPLLAPLTEDFHVLAMHHRPLWPGHDPHEFEDWQLVADDLARFLEQRGLKQVIGVGHSLGAVATMKVAWQRPELFSKLVLIEPVFLEPAILAMLATNTDIIEDLPMVHATRKRRTHWPDRPTAFEHFREKEVFERWPDEALWAYVNGALEDTAEGEVTLSFTREWEVQFYTRYPQGVWDEIQRVRQPTLAVRAADSNTLSQEAWRLWQELQPAATFVEISDSGHMVPMERPQEVAEAIKAFGA